MKSVVCNAFGPVEQIAVEDQPTPVPGAGMVLINVKAASINFPDALMVEGKYQVKPSLPFVPGMEFAGVVSAVGPGITRVKSGDRVAALSIGAFAEQALAKESSVLPLPDHLDFQTAAATFVTYGTALRALKRCADLKAGETLLVLGAAGGVGTAAIEIGKAMGAKVIAAASSTEKLALCIELGANYTIDYQKEDLRSRCAEITGKAGVDVVLDPVGGSYSEDALRSLAWRGRLIIVGFASGEIPRLPANLALLRERSIVGVYWGDSLPREPQAHEEDSRQLIQWLAGGEIRPVISDRVALSGVGGALRRLLDRHVKGKVLVLPEQS